MVRPLLPEPGWMRGCGGQPEAYCDRQMSDAIRYLVDNGIKWRAMPAYFPPWWIYAFFRRWRDDDLVREFHDRLRGRVREEAGKNPEPTAGVIDSQSVKADAVVGSDSRGYDGGKQINGRKRHAVVDTLGLLLAVTVTGADVGGRTAAQVLLHQVADAHHLLELVWADGGYTGSLVAYCLATFALVVSIVKRSDHQQGFVVLPKRWIVERLFAWLMRTRRLARDCERRTVTFGDDDLLVDEPAHDPPSGPSTTGARVNRPGSGSVSQPRATRRFAFERSASTRAGTASMPNSRAISWQVIGPFLSRSRSAAIRTMRW